MFHRVSPHLRGMATEQKQDGVCEATDQREKFYVMVESFQVSYKERKMGLVAFKGLTHPLRQVTPSASARSNFILIKV